MRKPVAAAVVLTGAIIAALSACTSGTAGHPVSTGQASLASDVTDLSYHGGADTAMSSPLMTSQPTNYVFRTIDDPADPTFNQLLGINDTGRIAGYFGSGAAGHPNQGYVVTYGARRSSAAENYPHSVQTQVTAINNAGTTVGFWSAANNADAVNDNTGFVLRHGVFHSVAFPAQSNANPPVNQLLGVNDGNVAVGFYTDAAGNNHGYRYDIDHGTFTKVKVRIPDAVSVTAAAINDRDQIAGFATTQAGATVGFLRDADHSITRLAYPGASMTQALGVSNRDEVVGVYQVGTGDKAATHGFTWTARNGFKTVDDPDGVGTTTINGVNDAGVLVGFYVDGAGDTHGMLAKSSMPNPQPPTSATPTTSPSPTTGAQPVTEHLTLSAMPNGTVAVSHTPDGHYHAHVDAYGFTPGSAHQVEIDAPTLTGPGPVVRFGTITANTAGVVDTTVDSVDTDAALPAGARFVIRLGDNTGDFNRNALAAKVIARGAVLPAMPNGGPTALAAVEQTTAGTTLGTPSGTGTVTYDPNAHTLTVTLDARGLTPGNHAAHIHNGSCRAQAGVRYMLMDYTAGTSGDIVNQTRTVTNVTVMPAAGSWYLNVHQGDSNSILTAAGQPAPSFRPLLCANG
jgi:Cu/Zn superoxide dismutase